jgi:hypothetical protein
VNGLSSDLIRGELATNSKKERVGYPKKNVGHLSSNKFTACQSKI